MTFQKSCRLVAPSARMVRISSRSSDLMPASVFNIRMKKNEADRQRHLRAFADAEPDDEHGRQGHARQNVQDGEERIADLGREGKLHAHDARSDTGRRAEREARQRLAQRYQHVGPDAAVAELLEQEHADRTGLGEEERVQHLRPDRPLPQPYEQHEHERPYRPDPEGPPQAARLALRFAAPQRLQDAVFCARSFIPRPLPPSAPARPVRSGADRRGRSVFVSGSRGRGRSIAMSAWMRPGPAGQDDHPIGKRHRLGQIVRNEQDGLAVALPDPQELGLQHQLASGRRARRTARPSKACRDRSQACGQEPRAGACPATAARDRRSRTTRGRSSRASAVPRRARSSGGTPRSSRPTSRLDRAERQGSSPSRANM